MHLLGVAEDLVEVEGLLAVEGGTPVDLPRSLRGRDLVGEVSHVALSRRLRNAHEREAARVTAQAQGRKGGVESGERSRLRNRVRSGEWSAERSGLLSGERSVLLPGGERN